jgi:hypothetical protein
VTRRKPAQELEGLVHDSRRGKKGFEMRKAWIFAGLVTVALIILNWIFY